MQTQLEARQQVFDIALAHLRKQGKRSMYTTEDGEICAYRGADGASKCAIGALISDARYRPEMEGHGVFGVANKLPAFARRAGDGFLQRVQAELHDDQSDDLGELERDASDLAHRYGLTYALPV